MTHSSARPPLAGVKVLDFSKILAGPLCTQYLGNMGAEVTKVEPIKGGDDTRAWPPFAEPGIGAVYLSANQGKRSLALDLKSAEGFEVARKLVAQTDIVIESFGTGVAERLGIDEPSLRKIRPDLIYCSISGFGREGPMADAPGYDVILQAYCGIMALSGEEGGGYMRSPISPVDQMTGMHALTGILAALHDRNQTGQGRRVDANLFDTAMGLMGYNLQSTWARGTPPPRSGSSHESLCPYQAFEAADGPVLLGVANDTLWQRFCAVAGLGGIADDPRFATNPARVQNRAETVARVASVLRTQPAAWWVEKLSAERVPCAPIQSVPQLMASEQTLYSGMLTRHDAGDGAEWQGIAQPVRFDNARSSNGLRAPRHGEHSHDILRQAGFPEAEIARLTARGVIAQLARSTTE